MTYDDQSRVEVSRLIRASSEVIFAVLSDPSRHIEIDGSGMLRGSTTDSVVSAVGDVFGMQMFNEEFGDYEMDNTVVEYEQGRRIAWAPARRDTDEESWHHRWGYELQPEQGGGTLVTEFFDLSRSPDDARRILRNGERWRPTMAATLELLDQLCGKPVNGPEAATEAAG